MLKLINTNNDGHVLVIEGDTHLSKWVVEHQSIITEATVKHRLMKMIQPGWTVVDGGASLGDHTVAYARCVGRQGVVMAFEPYYKAYTCLAFNCREYPQVECIHAALSDVSNMIISMLPSENAGATYAQKWITPTYPNLLCLTITLDWFNLGKCHFLKLDIEGMEPQALAGAMQTIRRCRPIIYTEINHAALQRNGWTADDVMQPLLSIGYKVELLDPKCGLNTPQTDIFLMP
jgi:FkbM family methyltransferase